MRRIFASTIALALGSQLSAQETPRPAPTVTLGPPRVSLGAPRSGSAIQPVNFLARGKVDDKAPLPPGPALNSGQPGAGNPTLPQPTPMGEPASSGSPIVTGPMPQSGLFAGPLMAGAPCPSCGNGGPIVGGPGAVGSVAYDPNFAPMPGGAFAPGFASACPYILYVRAEYLAWTIRDSNLPILLVAGPAGTVDTSDGNLNGTIPVVGGGSINNDWRSGFRINAGMWINECQNWGIDGSYFFLSKQSNAVTVASNGNPELGRPYFDPVGTPVPPLAGPGTYAEVVARAGVAGIFTAETSNSLWGADLNVRKGLLIGCRWRVDALAGFRYLNFNEELHINELSTATNTTVPMTGVLQDNFEVKNNFYGGQLGLVGELQRGRWSIDWFTKVALGTTNQAVDIHGAQALIVNGAPAAAANFGLLAQPTNSGHFTRNEFSVVPEFGINVGWQATPHLKLYCGYNFLYWSNVLRVGDQIDPVLNVPSRPGPLLLQRQPANPARPAVLFNDTDFWAQGVNVGLQFTW
jgi:Putative beta barrel porin-7 (BBP7)